jgi:hypothetical protein
VDGNGDYDPPPTDHVWRIKIDASDGDYETLVFQHSTNFVDIDWPH